MTDPRRLTIEEFIVRSKKIWGKNSFDYSNTVYKNADTKLELKCKKHSEHFFQRPDHHYNKIHGCKPCKKEYRIKRNLDKHGVEWTNSLESMKTKAKKTNLEKRGVDNPMKSEEVKAKNRETMTQRYGVPYSAMDPEIYEKVKTTNIEKYGAPCSLQNEDVKEKSKATSLEKYGAEYYSQTEECREKFKKTCRERYGVDYPMQNEEIFSKAIMSGLMFKEWVSPSGRIYQYQGYEHSALKELIEVEHVDEDDIVTERFKMPEIWYTFGNKRRRYYPDIFLQSRNLFIEVKSRRTYDQDPDEVKAKMLGCLQNGYDIEVRIYSRKGTVDQIIYFE